MALSSSPTRWVTRSAIMPAREEALSNESSIRAAARVCLRSCGQRRKSPRRSEAKRAKGGAGRGGAGGKVRRSPALPPSLPAARPAAHGSRTRTVTVTHLLQAQVLTRPCRHPPTCCEYSSSSSFVTLEIWSCPCADRLTRVGAGRCECGATGVGDGVGDGRWVGNPKDGFKEATRVPAPSREHQLRTPTPAMASGKGQRAAGK